jgi:hypothetical protein
LKRLLNVVKIIIVLELQNHDISSKEHLALISHPVTQYKWQKMKVKMLLQCSLSYLTASETNARLNTWGNQEALCPTIKSSLLLRS